MSAVHRYLRQQRTARGMAVADAYRRAIQHLMGCTAECVAAPVGGVLHRCPEGADLWAAYLAARDAS